MQLCNSLFVGIVLEVDASNNIWLNKTSKA